MVLANATCYLYMSCQCRLILVVHDGYCDVEAGSKSSLMSRNISVKFMKWASVFLFPLDMTSATTAAWLMLNFASWYNFFQTFRFNQCWNRKWYEDGQEIEAEKLFFAYIFLPFKYFYLHARSTFIPPIILSSIYIQIPNFSSVCIRKG